MLEAKFGYNNPYIPGHDVSTKIGRADSLKRAGITMLQPDVIYDPLPNLNATGEFSIPNGGSDTEDHVYQAIGNFFQGEPGGHVEVRRNLTGASSSPTPPTR